MEEYHVRLGLLVHKPIHQASEDHHERQMNGEDEEVEVDSDEIEMMMMVDKILDLATSFVKIFKTLENGNGNRNRNLNFQSSEDQTRELMDTSSNNKDKRTNHQLNSGVTKPAVSKEPNVKKIQKKKDSIKLTLDKKSR
ncbi:uncharacterized protein MELLADRAFT_72176 [Melampsora larici-populina 98AG31]|uniref:Uncharacterized protein n=1 Tax=Melampsora larici-populina (strain 98AG31 / pathotype 3-4-7) TaxID=747676 RepID=F4RQR1_MELLP|nr:uncharacterized protein MELLADRAFT_72176 [Melampsora larici-populina 98AG31]EGG05080.1 hypothetical protein MELLADRAFT_72176 [Melampsora larici-populina 98AG31]